MVNDKENLTCTAFAGSLYGIHVFLAINAIGFR